MALLTLLIVSLQLYGSLGRPPVVQPNTQAVAANQMDDSNTVTPSNQTVLDSSEETEPEEEWVPMITGEHPAWPVHNLTKRAQDLGGQLAPSKQGKYPKGYTSYGGQVWECPGAWYQTDEDPDYLNVCKKTKITPGQCYKCQWMGQAERTLVPDKELICDYFHTLDCADDPKYSSDKIMNDFQIYNKNDRDFFRGKTQRRIYGVSWPCCENFNSDMGLFWKVARRGDAPSSYRCLLKGKQQGLGV